MSAMTVHSNACPKLPDGRARHFYAKTAGVFVCKNCGKTSSRDERWEVARG